MLAWTINKSGCASNKNSRTLLSVVVCWRGPSTILGLQAIDIITRPSVPPARCWRELAIRIPSIAQVKIGTYNSNSKRPLLTLLNVHAIDSMKLWPLNVKRPIAIFQTFTHLRHVNILCVPETSVQLYWAWTHIKTSQHVKYDKARNRALSLSERY